MNDSRRERIGGTVDKLKGKARETIGAVTGNDEVRNEGRIDRGKSEVKRGIANARNKVDDLTKKVTNH
jgi:uncharacterized protein YjbJ (UPF0337 family)